MIRLAKLGYFTLKEAAEYLDMSRSTFYRCIAFKLIPDPVLEEDALLVWRIGDIKKVKKIIGGLPYGTGEKGLTRYRKENK